MLFGKFFVFLLLLPIISSMFHRYLYLSLDINKSARLRVAMVGFGLVAVNMAGITYFVISMILPGAIDSSLLTLCWFAVAGFALVIFGLAYHWLMSQTSNWVR